MPKKTPSRNPAVPVRPVTINQIKRRHLKAIGALRREHDADMAAARHVAVTAHAELEAARQAVKTGEQALADTGTTVKQLREEIGRLRAELIALKSDVELLTKERDGADVERARAEQGFREAQKEIERLRGELLALKRPPVPHTAGRRDVFMREAV